MSLEEVIGKFVSFKLMIKGSKQIIERGATSTPEVQPVAFKATEEKKEESTSSRLPIDAFKLDNEEMALIIMSFRQILKQRKGRDYKPRSKKVCYKCGKPGHFIAKCPLSSDSDRGDDKKGRRKEKKYYKKKGGDAHVCREWDSDESSTDSSSDEDAANIVVTKCLLFPNISHKCLMAKDGKKKKKVLVADVGEEKALVDGDVCGVLVGGVGGALIGVPLPANMDIATLLLVILLLLLSSPLLVVAPVTIT
jgi:hypothetical protein